MKVLAIIPARSGSKGIPGKNIKNFCGKPLIVHTIEQAIKSKLVTKVIVSTDSTEIADISFKHGAEVPFLRPENISGDKSTDLEYINHAKVYYKDEKFDYIIILRPTSPLRKTSDIDKAINALHNSEHSSLRSVDRVEEGHPYWTLKIKGEILEPFIADKGFKQYPRRQILPECYKLNGCIDIIRWSCTNDMYGDKIQPYILDKTSSIDINTMHDFIIAEAFYYQLKTDNTSVK